MSEKRLDEAARDDATIRPTKQMSCYEAGQFDKKFHVLNNENKVVGRQVTSGWTDICQIRARMGTSRKARIARGGKSHA